MAVGIGDIFGVAFRGKWHGQRTLSTFQYRVDIVTGTPTEAAFSAEFNTALQAAGKLVPKFIAACPNNYTLDEVWIQKLSPTRYARLDYATFIAGTYAQNSNVPNMAGVITRKGVFGSRKNIGSLHCPLPNLDPQIADGNIGGNYITALTNLATEMKALVSLATLGGLVPVLWHGGTAGNFDLIIQTKVQPTVRVMRRRTVGVGE